MRVSPMAEFFPDVPKIQYGGPKSRNPLDFKHYNADEVVDGKTMKEHLRFSVVYWHTFCNALSDPFGAGTALRPWDDGSNSVANAQRRAKVAFEFFEKLGAPFYAFHDRDVAPEGNNLKESHKNLDEVVKVLKDEQARTGVKLLWGTANLFTNPRYMHGAATSPNFDVFAYAGAQVKKAMEVTLELGGAGYTFWGGREGYSTLLNTDMKRELDHLARFLHMAVDYKKQIGFTGTFYIEPKPKEPTKHQYDSDAAACLNFLQDLRAPAALQAQPRDQSRHPGRSRDDARARGRHRRRALWARSTPTPAITCSAGTPTSSRPISISRPSACSAILAAWAGFTTGGINFDAKVRRESFEPIDLFHAHIGGMDAFARGFKIARAIIADGRLAAFVKERYRSWDCELGRRVEAGKAGFGDLESYILPKGDAAKNSSGRQEMLENLINEFI